MRILELQLTHFGKFHGRTIRLQPDVNVIEGRNEAGKSTIHTFIRGMLFGMDGKRGREELYSRYEPWESMGGYGGSMRFEQDGHTYLLERSFLREKAYVHLKDETTGEQLHPAQEQLQRLLGGMTESGYVNTVSIGQMKGATDAGLQQELKNHMANLGLAKSVEIDLAAAQEALLKRRKQLEGKLDLSAQEDRRQAESELFDLTQELERLSGREAQLQTAYDEGREREYRQYADEQGKKEEREKELENLNQEQMRLSHEKERWEKEKAGLARKIGNRLENISDEDIERGATLDMWKTAVMKCVAFGIAVSIIAIFFCADFYRARAGYNALFENSLYWSIGFTAAALLSFLLALWMVIRYRKRLNYYRLLVDKHMRLKESEGALRAIETKRNELLHTLAGMGDSGYYALHEANETLEKDLMRVEWEQEQALERYEEAVRQLARAQERCRKNEQLQTEIQAVRLASEAMFQAAGEIQDTFGEDMNRQASVYLEQITEGVYQGITVDADFHIGLRMKDRLVPLEQVSRGTIEQAYLCVRLAAADLLWPDLSMPLLLDDTFAYYDDDRTLQAIRLLKKVNHQVVIMTCQSREKRLLGLQEQ